MIEKLLQKNYLITCFDNKVLKKSRLKLRYIYRWCGNPEFTFYFFYGEIKFFL